MEQKLNLGDQVKIKKENKIGKVVVKTCYLKGRTRYGVKTKNYLFIGISSHFRNELQKISKTRKKR
jgi:hypothetical protein